MEENKIFSETEIANIDPFSDPSKVNAPIIKVIGVGGGGGNAVKHMYKTGIKNVDFVLCNTDRQAMEDSDIPTKVQIGKGLGAGGDPEEGRRIAEESLEQIATIFDSNTEMVFITAGMGGGTGTGAAPVVARVAREKGILTIGIVTIPFLFELRKKIVQAWEGVKEMRKNVDALLIINNERLTEIYPDLNFINAFEKADDTLTNAAKSVAEIITITGTVNVDFRDVRNTLKDGGVAIMSTGIGEGENRITNAFEDALRSPLLKEGDVNNAKRVLFNLYLSSQVSMSESREIRTFMERFKNENVGVIWGFTVDESLGDKVKVTLLATGFDIDTTVPSLPDSKQPTKQPTSITTNDDLIIDVYGISAEDKIFWENIRSTYVQFTIDEMDDDAFIEKIMNTPAYSRPKNFKQQIREEETATESKQQKNSTEKPIIF